MKKRYLRHTMKPDGPRRHPKAAHAFAHGNAFQIYGTNSIYSMVPKNACSTMRLSVAIGNGAIRDVSQADFIHTSNRMFKPSLRDLMESDYAFVVLRCPFSRLASCFLDKFMLDLQAVVNYRQNMPRQFRFLASTFRDFCENLKNDKILRADIHWRPQSDFLVFEEYDDYFCVERFKDAVPRIEQKTGIKIHDARNITQHGLDAVELLPPDEAHADTTVRKHRRMRENGKSVHPKALYDDALKSIVREVYAEDFELFDKLFPGCQLFDR